MTIGKFTWGTIKLVVNFVVVLIFGMTTYFIYSTITTLPLDVVSLDIRPEGTNFGVDPMSYLADDETGIGKVLKGDYFVAGPNGEMKIEQKSAVTNGLSYYAFDYSSEYPAEKVYEGINMDNINIWLGKGTIAEVYGYDFDDYEYIDNKSFDNGERFSSNERYTQADFPDAKKEGDPNFEKIGKTLGEFNDPRIGLLKYSGGHPKIGEDGKFVQPSFSFENYDAMVSGLNAYFTGDDGQKVVDAILSYWILRVTSQVDSYVNFKTQRLSGGGTGSGGLGAVQLSGVIIATGFNIDYYGFEVDKSATIITGASAKIGLQVLGPLLTTVDFTIAGWNLDGTRFRYSASASEQREKLSSDSYTGPDGVWKSKDKTGVLPTEAELWSVYNDYVPEKTTFADNSDEDDGNKINALKVTDPTTGLSKSEIRLCEFGMPAKTYSAHIVDLRTIKGAEMTGKPSNTDPTKAYTADIVCYTRSDGEKWEWVSANSARDLANGIGGYATDGGPVGYLYYTTLTITVGVFESGFMQQWKTDEFWDASIAGLIEAKVKVGTESIFTYDINEVMADSLGQDMSLPGQIKKMQAVG
jgi:hypothetical protein